jgi:hypothetical protein
VRDTGLAIIAGKESGRDDWRKASQRVCAANSFKPTGLRGGGGGRIGCFLSLRSASRNAITLRGAKIGAGEKALTVRINTVYHCISPPVKRFSAEFHRIYAKNEFLPKSRNTARAVVFGGLFVQAGGEGTVRGRATFDNHTRRRGLYILARSQPTSKQIIPPAPAGATRVGSVPAGRGGPHGGRMGREDSADAQGNM